MHERDLVGDTIRLNEHAEEDQYFAARDRGLIAKLRQAPASEKDPLCR